MKVCVRDTQSGNILGCIEYDGSKFTYDPPSMQGWEFRYVQEHGADAALENMVGATNGYWIIEEAEDA